MAIEITKDRYVIGNDFISKTYVLEKGHISSFSLTHRLSGATLTPGTGSELFTLRFAGPFGGEIVKASDLKVQDALPGENAFGSTLTVFFKPFRVRGCKIELQYKETLQNMDEFFLARLEFSCAGGEKAVLDFLDFAPLCVPAGGSVAGVRLPEKHKEQAVPALLGQPVFLENAFFGCLFPGCLNTVTDERVQVRRYYGRSLVALCDESGRFVSDFVVCGVAPGAKQSDARAAFFRYLEKTLPPVQTQHLLRFSKSLQDRDAAQTLLAEDQRLQAEGARFFDGVLLDKRAVFPGNATFDFSVEAPQALRQFGTCAASLGTALGLEIGLSTQSKGLFRRKPAGEDVCLADAGLPRSFAAFAQSLATTCGVTHYLLTLPWNKPCKEKAHAHPIGGDFQMFYYSAVFEAWINGLTQLKEKAPAALHFAFCGGPLSPWLLQWADALALNAGPGTASFDSALFEAFSKGVCVPTERLFSTEPQPHALRPGAPALFSIFALGQADPAALFACSNEESRLRPLLKRTVMFGGDPKQNELYGFAAFDSAEGLLSLSNPSDTAQEMTLTLDETLGVPRRFFSVGLSMLAPQGSAISRETLRYGDHMTRALAPRQTQVLHLGRQNTVLDAALVQAEDMTTLRLRFNQPVLLDDLACSENPAQAVTPDADGCGVLVRLTYPFALRNTLTFSGIRTLRGEMTDVTVNFMFSENGLLPQGALFGPGAFSIRVTFGSEENLQMYLQTERLLLAAEDGHITFRVGDAVLRSKARTNDIVQVCATRENSGVLKLYLNGVLDNSLRPLSPPVSLVPALPLCFDEKRTKLFARALTFDEV